MALCEMFHIKLVDSAVTPSTVEMDFELGFRREEKGGILFWEAVPSITS